MKKNIFSITILLLHIAVVAQTPVIDWQKSIGGSSNDCSYSIQKTIDGGYVAAGFSNSNDGDITGNNGYYDISVVKISSEGDLQWQKSLGGSDYEQAKSIQQTQDGGYIVTGYTNSNDGNVIGNHGNSDCWIVKLSNFGELQWQKTFGGAGYDIGNCIEETLDGGYILLGYVGSVDGDFAMNHGDKDILVVKLSQMGDFQWQKMFGGEGSEYSNTIQQTTDGGYIIAGSTQSDDGDITGFHGAEDAWIIKLDSLGILEWQKTLGGTNGEYASDVQQSIDGGYIVTGSSFSNNGDFIVNQGNEDIFVVKLSGLGEIEWGKTFGGSGYDRAENIKQTIGGGYVLAGYSNSNNGDISRNHGGNDIWIIKLSGSGILEWQKSIGGSYSDSAYCVDQNTDGSFIISGSSYSNDFDVTGNQGSFDMWIVKLTPDNLGTNNHTNKELKLYPNPITSILNIQNPNNMNIDKIILTDLSGKKILEKYGNNNQIDVQNLQQGLYLLELDYEGRKQIEKFIKQ